MLSGFRGFVPLFLGILLGSATTHPSSLPTTNRVLDIETFLITNSDISQLASIVLKFFDFGRCTESNLASPETCAKLASIPPNSMNVYVGYDKGTEPGQDAQGMMDEDNNNNHDGEPEIFAYALEKVRLSANLISKRSQERGRREKVFAILPDSNNIKVSGEHDIVLVIDPYPGYNFGHFLGLFYLDMDMDPGRCEGKHQIYMPDRTCFSVARKPRCQELGVENGGTPNNRFLHQSPKCYVDFLPTVRPSSSYGSNVTTNLLECVNLEEFGACPTKPTKNWGGGGVAHSEMRTRCRLFQRCDRGILIGGGWNQLHSTVKSEENLFKMEAMLLSNGFLKENVRTFYGNGEGIGGIGETGKSTTLKSHEVKAELRRHITKICRTKHCADTLFIYLNTPTTVNGNFLLWDSNNNGMADDPEVYTTEEFLSDISKCEAHRVIIVGDQSKTDIFVSLLRKSNAHPNVVFSAAGLADQPTRNGELTSIWANHSHPIACLKHIQQAGSVWMKDSTSAIFDASGGSLLNLSISGAPCGDLFSKELRPQYQGCQNLPTSIWFGSLKYGELGGESSEDEEDGGGMSGVIDGKQSRDTRDSNVSFIRRFL